ncbi:MAG: PD-(D/E)XK nuclease family protein [Gaiellales bacterium]
MGFSLVVGPAHAGKVALLCERFLGLLEHDPWLLVPNQAEVEVVERALVARSGALLAGTVGTFDRLFERLAYGDGRGRPVIGEAGRRLLVRRALAEADAPLAQRFPGVADAMVDLLAELEGSLVDRELLVEPLRSVVSRYDAALERSGCWDRGTLRRRALERLSGEFGSWAGNPVLAYGFEDLTTAEWRLLEALAARSDVHVSIPYEPGRPAYESLGRTVASLAGIANRVDELGPRATEYLPSSLAHLERTLFDDDAPRTELDTTTVRFFEGAGLRSTVELIADDILQQVRAGTDPAEVALVVPGVDPYRATVRAVFAASGIPVSIEAAEPLRATSLGRSLLALLRFAWANGERPQLYSHLRSPYAALPRRDVDWVEGLLRGRGVRTAERTVEVTAELRGGRPLETLELATGPGTATAVVRRLLERMVRSAHGLERPPTTAEARADLRAEDAVVRTLDELDEVAGADGEVTRLEVLTALERVTVRDGRPREPGRVAVLDLRRARTRRFEVVYVLGLEQGVLPRRGRPTPLLDDAERARLENEGARLVRPDAAARDRYLFLTACTRPRRRLVLVREAVSDEGTPREPSPFWDAVRALYDEDSVRRATVRRSLSDVTRELESATTERERLRALVSLDRVDPVSALALARANDWERRLRRARAAFTRSNLVMGDRARGLLGGREAWSVSDLERMASCSAAWFFERYLKPGPIDRSIDRMLRGSVLHVAMQRFYQQLSKALGGAERVTDANVEEAVALVRECVRQAVATGVKLDVDELERRELESGLQRDLEQLVRQAASWESSYVPRRLEVSFKHELAPGVLISGKIDRVDADPLSARGMVIDYKSGAASSALEIERRRLLQAPLYMLVLREQLGLEAMGGIYVPVGGSKKPRGVLLDEPGERVPGFSRDDYVDPERFEELIAGAREAAVGLVERIRAGDIQRDPVEDRCPQWCDLWRMCRRERA